MKALAIEFAPPAPWSYLWWCGPALVLISCMMVSEADWRRWRELREVQARHNVLRGKVEATTPNVAPDTRVPPRYREHAGRVASMAGFATQATLAAIETVVVPGVQVFAADIDAAQGKARVEVGFATYADLISYVDQLNGGEPRPLWKLSQATNGTGATSGMVIATIEASPPPSSINSFGNDVARPGMATKRSGSLHKQVAGGSPR